MVRLLALSGSLRASSSNMSLLEAAALVGVERVSIEPYRRLDQLPHFNPDLEESLPEHVAEWRAAIGRADGLVISCPEYARGIPGSFKNALDWLVASHEFPGKPVALFNASPRASDAQAALRLVLTTMSADVVDAASITVPLLGRSLAPDAIAADPVMRQQMADALHALRSHIERGAQASG